MRVVNFFVDIRNQIVFSVTTYILKDRTCGIYQEIMIVKESLLSSITLFIIPAGQCSRPQKEGRAYISNPIFYDQGNKASERK
jgi:hypothetical protein